MVRKKTTGCGRLSLRRFVSTSLLVCFFCSGAAGLIYRVVWSKALGLIFGHMAYTVRVHRTLSLLRDRHLIAPFLAAVRRLPCRNRGQLSGS
jgi:hypothetical protein